MVSEKFVYDNRGNVEQVTFGPFTKGMNNRLEDHAIPEETARNLVNVDVDNVGKVKRRQGPTKVLSGYTQYGYSCDLGSFYLNLNSLYKFGSVSPLLNNLVPPIAYGFFNDQLFISDKYRTFKYDGDTISHWGIKPIEAFSLKVTAGTLPPGTYLATMVGVDAAGRESGSAPLAQLILESEGGIQFTNFVVPQGYAITTVRLYLSAANSSILFCAAEISTSVSSYIISLSGYDSGKTLETQFCSCAPSFKEAKFYKGRAYVVDLAGVIRYSPPYAYDLFDLNSDYYLIPGDICIFEPVTSGIYVATKTHTYFLQGTPEEGFEQTIIFNYGAIPGTAETDKDSNLIYWQSTKGTIRATQAGEAQNIQEQNIAPGTGISGSAMLRAKNGYKQYIVCINNATASSLAAKSFIDAEIIRKGV